MKRRRALLLFGLALCLALWAAYGLRSVQTGSDAEATPTVFDSTLVWFKSLIGGTPLPPPSARYLKHALASNQPAMPEGAP